VLLWRAVNVVHYVPITEERSPEWRHFSEELRVRLVNLGETTINRAIQIKNGEPVVFSIRPFRRAVGECFCEEEQ